MTEERVRHKHTILVVEDESLIRFGLVDILETEGICNEGSCFRDAGDRNFEGG